MIGYTLMGHGSDRYIQTGEDREIFESIEKLIAHGREVILEMSQSWKVKLYRSQNEYRRELSEEFFSLIEKVETLPGGDFKVLEGVNG